MIRSRRNSRARIEWLSQAQAGHQTIARNNSLGIGILPDAFVRNRCIQMSRTLSGRYTLSYRLHAATSPPHLTLYQANLTPTRTTQESIEDWLDSHIAPIEVVLDTTGVFSQTFIFYDCIRTDALRRLHEDLVERLRTHVMKGEPGPGIRQGLTKLTKREADYMIKYGYPFVRESFRPHFTIGRVVGEIPDIDEVRKILRKQTRELRNYRFLATQIIVYEVGIDGRCARILSKRHAR